MAELTVTMVSVMVVRDGYRLPSTVVERGLFKADSICFGERGPPIVGEGLFGAEIFGGQTEGDGCTREKEKERKKCGKSVHGARTTERAQGELRRSGMTRQGL